MENRPINPFVMIDDQNGKVTVVSGTYVNPVERKFNGMSEAVQYCAENGIQVEVESCFAL